MRSEIRKNFFSISANLEVFESEYPDCVPDFDSNPNELGRLSLFVNPFEHLFMIAQK